MGKFHQNDLGSVVLDHGGGGFKLWTSCRRRIIDTIRCGGGGASRHRHPAKSPPAKRPRARENKEKRSERLSELMRVSELAEEEEEEVRRKVEALEELETVVKRLQCGGGGAAAREVRRLAKEDSDARVTLALLGAIPPLVAMLDSGDLNAQIAALYALLNLGIGNDVNKAAIVKAGAIHKMLDLIEPSNQDSTNPDVSAAIVANFLGLSALDSNKPIIGASGAIRFLVKMLMGSTGPNRTQPQVVQDSLRALYNLSILALNVAQMIEIDGFVSFLLMELGETDVSDRILAILSNLVSSAEGRRAVGSVHDSFQILVDVLSWVDSPGCQEKAAYVLMVMAHKSYRDRLAMVESGVMSSLLELTLLGSTLAQKRASRVLEILRVDKGKQVSENYADGGCGGGGGSGGGMGGNVSAPLCGSVEAVPTDLAAAEDGGRTMSDESMAVKNLVQQSLQSNMRRIVKRANLPQDFVPSEHFSSLTSIPTSKSLPF